MGGKVGWECGGWRGSQDVPCQNEPNPERGREVGRVGMGGRSEGGLGQADEHIVIALAHILIGRLMEMFGCYHDV